MKGGRTAVRLKGRRTPTKLILYVHILLRSHTEQGGHAVPIRVSVREPLGGHAARAGGHEGVVGHCVNEWYCREGRRAESIDQRNQRLMVSVLRCWYSVVKCRKECRVGRERGSRSAV
jgi:hypothetical protein